MLKTKTVSQDHKGVIIQLIFSSDSTLIKHILEVRIYYTEISLILGTILTSKFDNLSYNNIWNVCHVLSDLSFILNLSMKGWRPETSQ